MTSDILPQKQFGRLWLVIYNNKLNLSMLSVTSYLFDYVQHIEFCMAAIKPEIDAIKWYKSQAVQIFVKYNAIE